MCVHEKHAHLFTRTPRQGWSPLADPQRCAADFRRWRPLLEPSGHTAGGGVTGVCTCLCVLEPTGHTAGGGAASMCTCVDACLFMLEPSGHTAGGGAAGV